MKLSFIFLFFLFAFNIFGANKVEIKNNQLQVDGVPQPQLYGAEIQYFRLRGGAGKNIPREKVLEIWNRTLDHALEAGMNAVSFYIPWDFHEYKEGHFDFDGSADEDMDGNPDYPSRDILTFIKLLKARGITRIMARPGPYINAEWGFLGFGAIPLWFHQKYPDSHMRNSSGLRTKLYDYHSPDLLRHTKLWFKKVYAEVLKANIGQDGPILFLQLDNETNFMWQSIYNHDYGKRALSRYREFLRSQFNIIDNLNALHGANWSDWNEVNPPLIAGLNIHEDRAWYQFQDYSIYSYLKKLRQMWEEIGVREPQVIFTLAESYNAMKNGLLPNFHQRNAKNETGMMTMNLYPKTYDLPSSPLMNLPFKADHDVQAMDAASDLYLGSKQEWLMGPEIQGGWWRNTPVSSASRQQTYLSTLGHGLKALFIYYFSEGDNWQADWAKNEIMPLFNALRNSAEYKSYSDETLPSIFWSKLQSEVDQNIIVGMDVYRIMNDAEASSYEIYFDAPLDHEGHPKRHYQLVKDFGLKLIKPHEDFLAKAVRVNDPVVILKNTSDHAPSLVPGIDSVLLNAEWSGALLGYLSQVGISASIHHWKINNTKELFKAKIIFYQDAGMIDPQLLLFFENYLNQGGTVVSLLGHSLAQELAIGFKAQNLKSLSPIKVHGINNKTFDAAPAPIHSYDSLAEKCLPMLWQANKITGFICPQGKGSFIQLGVNFYDIYNSDWYGKIQDHQERVHFLSEILQNVAVQSAVKLTGAEQATVFARHLNGAGPLWITVKNGKDLPMKAQIKISAALVKKNFPDSKLLTISSLMNDKKTTVSLNTLVAHGFPIEMNNYESEVYFIQESHE